MKDFLNFALHNCILVFDTEQVYLKLQVTNLEEYGRYSKPQTPNPRKKLVFRYP